jgi:hypothetical protein
MGDGGWRLRRGQRARHVRKQEASRNLRDPSWSWSGRKRIEYAYRNGSFLREANAAMEVGLAHTYSERGKAAYMGKGRGRLRLSRGNINRTHGDGQRCQHNWLR